MRAGMTLRWAGALEGVDEGLLYGWCVDTHDADARVVLEVLHEGDVLGSVVADVARQDLQSTFAKLGAGREPADPCHGFVADIGRFASLAHSVRVRIANSQEHLPGLADASQAQPPRGATSAVFSDAGLRVHGRVAANARMQTLRAFVGSAEVAHAAVGKLDEGRFVIDLPATLADGQLHEVRIVDGKGAPLNGSPVTVCCRLQGGRALLDARKNKLAANLFDQYERLVPRSLGLAFYPQWKQAFEPSASKPESRIGIVHTDASSAQLTRALRDFDFVIFVRKGDALSPAAPALMAEAFKDKRTLAAYADSEFCGVPWFKPAWNVEYAFASDCALFPLMVRTRAFVTPKAGVVGVTSLMWTALARAHLSGPSAIRHVPHVLYSMNTPPSPTELAQRTHAAQAALRLIEPQTRLESSAFLSPDGQFQPRRLVRNGRAPISTVSLIIPTRDRVELLERCIASIRKHTRWPNLEIIVVDNDSAEPATHKYFRAIARQGVRVLAHPGPFNFAAMNNDAVRAARGSIVGLINNDIEATHDGWLGEIVGQLLRPGVSIVGAKLLWPNGMVQHGGVVLGMGNGASHFGNRLADGDWGDHGHNQLLQQVSAVTAACLFIRRKDYLDIGGMDARAFPVNFNDVDLCLKIRARGGAVVWTPHACLLHAESASRGKDEAPSLRARVAREIDNLRTRWGHVLLKDPAYHPSLNLDPHSHPFGGLAIPPRDRSARLGSLTE
jgi:O-antigen biosynthesis protein